MGSGDADAMSTLRPEDIIRRGGTVTGRMLRDAMSPDPRAFRAGRGIRVRRNVAGQTVISLKHDRRVPKIVRLYGRVLSSLEQQTNIWFYAMEKVVNVNWSIGPSGWQPPGVPGEFDALNLAEMHNTGSGTHGTISDPYSEANGLNIEQLPGNFRLRPIPDGSIVQVFEVGGAGGLGMYFDRPNAVDGTC